MNQSAEPCTPTLDVLQATLFYLMNRYTARPTVPLAAAVVDQLTALCGHPEIILLPIQRRLYARLLNEWRARAPVVSARCAAATLH